MHRQNINLLVCVCVCPSLSVNSPTGQTPQRIFTVDSLKDADLRKMCLLGSRWWVITFMGPKSPQTPTLGAWIGISSQIWEKFIQIAISSNLCIGLTWNLTGSCGQQQRLRGWSRMVVKQFQAGGRPPFWKSIYRYISVWNHQIFMTWSKNEKVALDRLRVRQNVFLVLKQLHYCPRLNVRVHSSKVELAAAGVHPVGMISSHASV